VCLFKICNVYVKHFQFGAYDGVSKSFRSESITKYTLTTINTRWETTKRVMAEKFTRLTHKIAIQLHLVAESCTTYSSRSRRPVRKLLDTPSYLTNCLNLSLGECVIYVWLLSLIFHQNTKIQSVKCWHSKLEIDPIASFPVLSKPSNAITLSHYLTLNRLSNWEATQCLRVLTHAMSTLL
jgi:hypothetical protein